MSPLKGERNPAHSTPSQTQLGDFLRSRRERLSPESIGINDKRRRRTPGLRREEVAERAGIGTDWYIRLEQGRAVTPSPATIDALACALRLSKVEHTHLKTLARSPDRAAFVREIVPDNLLRMIAGLPCPAYITGRRWDLLAWNAAAAEVFPEFNLMPPQHQNILFQMLTSPAMKKIFGVQWAAEAKRMIALFRTTFDILAGDPAYIGLLTSLQLECPEFNQWWEEHEVSTPASAVKLLQHPSKGLLRFETATFQASDNPALKLAIFTPISRIGG